MSEDASKEALEIEAKRLDLERFKARLSYRKSIVIGGFVAIAIALIPPVFQFVSFLIDTQNKDAERQADIQKFRSQYISAFLDNALNQDIELRLRLAQYFKFVAPDKDLKDDWSAYYAELEKKRNDTRDLIEKLEEKLASTQAGPVSEANSVEQDKVLQQLGWLRAEVGYVAPNKSVIRDPRNTNVQVLDGIDIALDSIPLDKQPMARKIVSAFANAGFGRNQQIAALSNAIVESNLDPNAVLGNSIGLFLISQQGFGKGLSAEELKDPDINLNLTIDASKRALAFVNATNLDAAIAAFVRYVSRPANSDQVIRTISSVSRQLTR
ncbi:hypothetical protein GFL39_17710 [Rhizobium leguminosarum bv. viciae]|uniref:hypothetical protein n=1 Tax=Rhizobium leguminosarum TaxID=384 RepID=UPI0014427F19|nr:hypothetical protein [Rhizobium leguminosarum]NKK65339.1 hypothetical protein [Rhizobium leguminosarum bv. viciae]NKL06739.1 hypothetical protein [Rhizobium leguminosarum bv. viciae]NKL92848.1 hypothetical protein [Rhizobium leguminosarum bv. viciae]NKM93001.1 hypothetical protein [Rhizobium leguminosarum bv. viciae]